MPRPHFARVQNWLQARYLENWKERNIVSIYTADGGRDATPSERVRAFIPQREFHDFLMTLDAPVQETVQKCEELEWIATVQQHAVVGNRAVGVGPRYYAITNRVLSGRGDPSDQFDAPPNINKPDHCAEWDVFISHASEDKKDVAEPLCDELTSRGRKVWLDVRQLTLGDNLRREIDKGLLMSRFAAVILSPIFFQKEWAQRELDGLAALQSDGRKRILPIWHKIGYSELAKISPTVASLIAVNTEIGIPGIADSIERAIEAATPIPPSC